MNTSDKYKTDTTQTDKINLSMTDKTNSEQIDKTNSEQVNKTYASQEFSMTTAEIEKLPTKEAIDAFTKYISINPNDDQAYTLRGLRYWSLDMRAAAINDYLKALSINPESSAKQALEAAQSILGFYHTDLYNP